MRALFVHHTDTVNSYSRAQAYAQVRAIYAFHTKVRGWNDIGYNFLVDRYGRVFEGRRGSITTAVMGAHTGGFNTDSLGVSVLGTFVAQAPPAAAMDALTGVLAWKAAQYGINPRAAVTLTSAGGPFTPYPVGRAVRISALSAHRDVDSTECPGDALYALMPLLRRQVAARLVPGLVGPELSAPTATWGGPPVVLDAAIPTTQTWTLTVSPACGGIPVRTLSGRATGRLSAGWNLLDAHGAPVPPGIYRLALDTRSPVGTVPTWTTSIEVWPTDAAPPGTCPVRRVPAAEGADPVARAVAVGRVDRPHRHHRRPGGRRRGGHRRRGRRPTRPCPGRAAARHTGRRARSRGRRGPAAPPRHPRRRGRRGGVRRARGDRRDHGPRHPRRPAGRRRHRGRHRWPSPAPSPPSPARPAHPCRPG